MLVVDSDLASGWIFEKSSPYEDDDETPIPAFSEIWSQHGRPILPFVCVPNLLMVRRILAERIEISDLRGDFLRESEAVLNAWLSQYLEIAYPTSTNARAWTQIACDPNLPEEATDAHVWIAVMVQSLSAKFPGEVFLGSRESRIYSQMESLGFLPPGILNPWGP